MKVLIIILSFLFGYYFRRLILKLQKMSKWYQKRIEQKKRKKRQKEFGKKMKDLEIK